MQTVLCLNFFDDAHYYYLDYALGTSAGYDALKDVTATSSMFGYDCSIILPRETYAKHGPKIWGLSPPFGEGERDPHVLKKIFKISSG